MATRFGTQAGFTVSLLVAASMLVACDNSEDEKAAAPAAPPPAVVFTPAVTTDVTETVAFQGRVVAVDSVDLRPSVTGFLIKRLFTEGEDVKVGEVLFEIDPAEYQAALDSAVAKVAGAQASLDKADIDIERARALIKTNAVAQAKVDDAVAQQGTAKADLMAAQAAEQSARIELGYTRITAPIAGRIGITNFSVGNLVDPSSGVLASIVSQDPIYVTFPVSQRQILDLREQEAAAGTEGNTAANAVVSLSLANGTTYGETGKIDFGDIRVSQGTDTLTVRAVFPNPKRILVPGQLVNVVVSSGEAKQSLVVPQSALLTDQAGPYVLLVDAAGKVEIRRITAGGPAGTNVVVADGLKAGDKVIVEGMLKVRPGQEVQATEAKPTAGI